MLSFFYNYSTKYLSKYLKITSYLSYLFAILLLIPAKSSAVWPFSSQNEDEIQKKLDRSALTASTRYYARGATYLPGQLWSEKNFLTKLQAQNFRVRDVNDSVLGGDAKKISLSECRQFTKRTDLPDGSYCWLWQNNDSSVIEADQNSSIVVIGPDERIHSTWTGPNWQENYKVSLNPVLAAQYRGQEPIMQNELKISEFPVNCMNAVMAIEDNEFLEHSGVSYTGLARAVLKNVIKGRAAQGGSTITQQLVKNYFLTPEKTLTRKVKELFLAIKVESQWTKNEILETYLNIIYMGQAGAFQVRGFAAAANYYFNKRAEELDLHECALLAAIINNPAQNNPWKKADKALQRRNLVLTKMLEHQLISSSEAEKAKSEPLPKLHEVKAVETAPFFFDAVRKQMLKLGLTVEGAQVFTSLDLEAQELSQKSLQKHILELEKARKNILSNKEKGQILEGLVLSSENSTGLVNVVVGGQNFRQTQFNRAIDSHRQIGSLIKPFIYLSSLINGWNGDNHVNPLTTVTDQKFEWKYDRNKTWSPDNYEKKFYGQIPLYFALKESINTIAAQLAEGTGLEKMISFMPAIGITSEIPNLPSTSLGTTQHYPLEILEAYSTLARLGAYEKSSFIEKVYDSENKKVFEFKPEKNSVLDSTKVAVLVGMMKETLRTGTAKAAKILGYTTAAAGKTGTTSDNKDAWFAGFTPYQTTVVWLGYDQKLSSKLTGGSGAVPVWVNVMKFYDQFWASDDFAWPESVEYRPVNLFSPEPTNLNQQTELIFEK